jgi:hypothetical protein
MSFRKMVVELEVLYDDKEIDGSNLSLQQIVDQIEDGCCSGSYTAISNKKASAQKMARLAIAQGSDPEFFGIDKNGRKI